MQARGMVPELEVVLDMLAGNPAITAEIEIHGGMITAYSEQGACIGSGRDSSSKVLIDGGTICLDNKNVQSRGMLLILERGMSNSTQAQTDVTITGGTICLIGADAYIPRPIIYGWEQVDGNVADRISQKMRRVTRFITPQRI